MLLGVILAVVLGALSVAKITSSGLTYRQHEVFQSTSTVLLTQNGSTFADPSRYAALTDLYSQLANSDAVHSLMLKDGGSKDWKLIAAPVPPVTNPTAILPVITLSGQAFTPAQAIRATVLGRKAFVSYITKQPGSAGLTVLQSATPPKVVQPRKKTLLIVVILGVLSATVGLCFVLENLRPSDARGVKGSVQIPAPAPASARSAAPASASSGPPRLSG
jgi:hypothetical protein